MTTVSDLRIANDELEHFGVKGMKWGIRNDDSKGSSGTASKIKSAVTSETAKTVGTAAAGAVAGHVIRATVSLGATFVTSVVTGKAGPAARAVATLGSNGLTKVAAAAGGAFVATKIRENRKENG